MLLRVRESATLKIKFFYLYSIVKNNQVKAIHHYPNLKEMLKFFYMSFFKFRPTNMLKTYAHFTVRQYFNFCKEIQYIIFFSKKLLNLHMNAYS